MSIFADTGADIHLKIINAWSCLITAAVNGHLYLSQAIIDKHDFSIIDKHDFYVNCNDNEGWPALHHSAKSASYELVSFLVILELIFTSTLIMDGVV